MSKKKHKPPVLVARDPRDARSGESAERVLCAVCGVSMRDDDAQRYLDTATEPPTPKLRCIDCAAENLVVPYVREPVPAPEPAAPVAPDDDLAARFEHVKAARDELANELESVQRRFDLLLKRICGAVGVPGASGVSDFQRATEVLDRVFADAARAQDIARGASPTSPALQAERDEAQAQVEALVEELAEVRQAHEEERAALLRVLEERQHLMLLLRLDGEASAGIAPWMLDLTTRFATDAPSELGEGDLALLLAEAVHAAFAERTNAHLTALSQRLEHPAGVAFSSLVQAAEAVEDVIRQLPDEPADEKKEALDAAWMRLNTAANTARDVTLMERERLTLLEEKRRFAERPQITDRKIAVKRRSEEG